MGSVYLPRRIATFVLIVATLMSATLVAGLAGAQGAPGNNGNRDAAALCRGNGYKSLTRPDGTPFTSVGECISYAAQNGGTEVLATVTPVPSPTPTPEPQPSPVPSPTPDPGPTSLVLLNDPPATCSALAQAYGLEPGISYSITMQITWADGSTSTRSVDVPSTHLGYYGYRAQWSNIYGDREIFAFLYSADGVLLNQAGPLVLDDECAAP
jgi:hypothetical protein